MPAGRLMSASVPVPVRPAFIAGAVPAGVLSSADVAAAASARHWAIREARASLSSEQPHGAAPAGAWPGARYARSRACSDRHSPAGQDATRPAMSSRLIPMPLARLMNASSSSADSSKTR